MTFPREPRVEERLLWLSNVPAPYRVPVQDALTSLLSLRVRYLADTEPNRHWRVPRREFAEVLRSVHVTVPPQDSRLYLCVDRRLKRDLRRSSCALIGGWESPAAWQVLAVAGRADIATVAFYESTLASHAHRGGPVAWLRRWFFRRVDAVLTAGHASTEAVLAMGVPAERIVTGFNSVDVRTFHEGAVAVRAAKPRAGSGHAFLYVGQLIERKNVSAALAAFARVAAVEDTFDVVGTGPLAEELQERAGRLGVADRVRLVGHREGDGLIAAYANADTLVLPSTEEVWGLVVNEALAAGLHVVVSDCAGVVPSVRHMPGVFVAAPTVQGLAEAMEASRAEWQGPIEQPLMLEHTPERAAEAVLQAVEVARHGREAAR